MHILVSRVRDKLRAGVRNDAPLLAATLSAVCFGVYARLAHLAYPAHLTFDEHHFVENARNYLAHKADWNDHPPLGKLLLVIGMKLFGDTSLGWRIVPALLGILTVVLAHQLGARLFRDRRAGWIAAAFIALDGFHVAYSRTALLDGMLTCFIVGVALVTVVARRGWQILLASVIVGLAAGIKVNAFLLVVPILLVTIGFRRAPRLSALYLALVPCVFYAVFALGLAMSGKAYGPVAVVEATRALLTHHLGLTEMTHPLTSRFYTWLLPTRPITLRFSTGEGGMIRAMTSLGNPLLWWASSVAIVAGITHLLWKGVQSLAFVGEGPAGESPRFFVRHGAAVGWIVMFWGLFVSPWILSRRDSYLYHYLPSHAFAVLLVAGFTAWLYGKRRLAGLGIVLIISLVSVFYLPVNTETPVSRTGFNARLFFPGWR